MKKIILLLLLVSLSAKETYALCGQHCYDNANSQYNYWDSYYYSTLESYMNAAFAFMTSAWLGAVTGSYQFSWISGADLVYNGWWNPWDDINAISNNYYNGWSQTTNELNYCLAIAGC